jgi:hypothetical protein
MAVRTISRDEANPRVVLVWPKDVTIDDVHSNERGADYAQVYGEYVQAAQISTDVFKAAFGFLPLTGSVDRYIMRKACAPETVEQKLMSAIKAIVKDVLDD